MTLDRHTLAERLRPHLSPTEPRLASELLVLAGVQTGSRVGGTVAAALQELRAAGHARPAGGTRQALRWLASAPGDLGSETLPLARLDATLTLTTTARTTAGGTRRTELAATVTLGPSWPATTPTPPRWSTAFSDAQVAGGALAGARTNAIARAEAQLRALRTSKTTLPLLPTEDRMTRPNPLLLPSKDREDFLAYLASVARGARRDSACTWLGKRGLARTTSEAETWLEEAVEAGVLAEHKGTASDGTVVLRYSPADPSVKASPLPKSSAPAEEPPPAPKAPSKPAAAPAIEEDPGDPADDSGAEDDPRALEEEDPPEEGEIEKVRHKLWEAESKIKGLEEQIQDWDRRHREADRAAARELATAHKHADELKAEGDILHEAICRAVPEVRGTSAAHMAGALDMLIRNLRADYKTLYDQATEKRPTHYQPDPAEAFAASTASWLVSLSEEGWAEVSRARAELAESRRLREASHRLELAALEALDRVVGARPAAPQAPAAPELVPDPIPLGPPIPATPEPPASAEQANDDLGAPASLFHRSVLAQVNRGLCQAGEIAEALKDDRHRVSTALSALSLAGWIVRVRPGHYAPRRAA